MRSRNCRPRLVYFLAIEMTRRRLASTISFLAMRASRSPFWTMLTMRRNSPSEVPVVLGDVARSRRGCARRVSRSAAAKAAHFLSMPGDAVEPVARRAHGPCSFRGRRGAAPCDARRGAASGRRARSGGGCSCRARRPDIRSCEPWNWTLSTSAVSCSRSFWYFFSSAAREVLRRRRARPCASPGPSRIS